MTWNVKQEGMFESDERSEELVSSHKLDVFQVAADGTNDPL